ncbi:hypothetical protein TRVL_09084 [Trypanosoma vivax]|nr:hypothetical protein TRVL_09084 [Trypanosoma vivax]
MNEMAPARDVGSRCASVRDQSQPFFCHMHMQQSDTHFVDEMERENTVASEVPVAVGRLAQQNGEKVPSRGSFFRWYWSRLTGCDSSRSTYGFRVSWSHLTTFVFVATTLLLFSLTEHYGSHLNLNRIGIFFPAFAASATILFTSPTTPNAQPRSLFFSHITAAIVGVSLAHVFQFVPNKNFGYKCAASVGVGLHLALMSMTNTMHPPASATCVTAALTFVNKDSSSQGFLFVLYPILTCCIFLFLCSWLMNNLVAAHSPYPRYWW